MLDGKIVDLSFNDAFSIIRKSNGLKKMRLRHWNDDVGVYIQTPDENSKMTAPYLYVNSRYGNVPWMPTQIELFSMEWEVHEL